MTGASITVTAPAKLNLALAVGPAAADGMHPICSWMVTVDLCDELEVRRLPADRLSRYAVLWHEDARRPSEIDWSITRDLAVRAHLALEHHVDRRLPAQVKLQKRIPVGSGLGGGSSDAAAMLHAVNRLFDLELDTGELAAIGATLGADVPFLVHGGSALVEGCGERITRHEDVPALHAVLALLDAPCPTGEVYDLFDEQGSESGEPRFEAVHALIGACPAPPRPHDLFNDLTAAAVGVAPALGTALERVTAVAERPAHVSGSGSSVFVLCDDARHADDLAAAVEQATDLPAIAVQGLARAGATVEPARDAPEPRGVRP